MVKDLGVLRLGYRLRGLWFKVQGVGLTVRVCDLGLRVYGLGSSK
jgi:hypothetical protein